MAKFKTLRKLGFLVLSFESNKRMPKGSSGMTDYLIIGKRFYGDIYFVERKYKGDRMRAGQLLVADYLSKSGNYFVLTENNENEITEKILSKTLDK